MGMYSTFVKQSIVVTGKNALIKLRDGGEVNGEFANLISEDGKVEFYNWSECKIYGYSWKTPVLKELAKHIEGWVEFVYEEGFKFRFVFEDGKAYMKTETSVVFGELEEIN